MKIWQPDPNLAFFQWAMVSRDLIKIFHEILKFSMNVPIHDCVLNSASLPRHLYRWSTRFARRRCLRHTKFKLDRQRSSTCFKRFFINSLNGSLTKSDINAISKWFSSLIFLFFFWTVWKMIHFRKFISFNSWNDCIQLFNSSSLHESFWMTRFLWR